MAVIALRVPGMTCRRCVRIVTARLRDLPGVVMVAADAAAAEVVVHGEVSEDRVRAALAEVSVLVNGACDGEEVNGLLRRRAQAGFGALAGGVVVALLTEDGAG